MKNRSILLALFALAIFALPFSHSTTLSSKFILGNYTCGVGSNLTCFARDVVLVNSTGTNFTTWGIVYNQYSIGADTTNKTEVYYQDSTGFRIRLCANCSSGFGVNSNLSLVTTKGIDAFYDAGTNKVFVLVSKLSPNGAVMSAPLLEGGRLISLSLSTKTFQIIDQFNLTTGNFFQFNGLALLKVNSSDFLAMYGTQAAVGNTQFFMREYAMTGTNIRSYSQTGSTCNSFANSMYSLNLVNSTDLREGSSNSTAIGYCRFNYNTFSSSNTPMVTMTRPISPKSGVFFYNSTTGLYYSSDTGNQELNLIDTIGLTPEQLTTSSANEFIDRVDLYSNGVARFAVWNDLNNVYLDSFQATNGQGGSGGVCNAGYTWVQSLGQCVPLSELPTFPQVQLYVYDRACATNLHTFNVPNIFDDCNDVNGNPTGGAFDIHDWLYIQYLVNGKFALPDGFNESQFPNSQALSAVCSVCDITEDNCFTMNASNFNIPYGKDRNKPFWGFDARQIQPPFVSPFVQSDGSGQLVTVRCSSNVTDSSVKNQFYTANTFFDQAGDSFKSGFGNNLIDSINTNQTPITSRREVILASSYPQQNIQILPYGVPSTAQCIFRMSPLTSGDIELPMTYSSQSVSATTSDTIFTFSQDNTNNAAGNYKVTSACSVKSAGAGDIPRYPATLWQKNFAVLDQCAGNFSDSTISLLVLDKNGTEKSVFSTAENVYLSAIYRAPDLSSFNPFSSSQCSVSVNFGNTTLALSDGFMQKHPSGVQTAYLQANPLVPDQQEGLGLNFGAGEFSLTNGTYTVTVSCRSTDASQCVAPQTAVTSFTINATDGCAGTNNACTLDTCGACGSSIITCENGRQFTASNICVSRECIPTDSTTSTRCDNEQLYSIQTDAIPNSVACGEDNINLRTRLLKSGSQIPPLSTLPDLQCNTEVVPVDGTVPLGIPLTFNIPIPASNPDIDFSLQGRLGNYQYDYCGKQFNVLTTCYSKNFSAPKSFNTRFIMGEQGNDCKLQRSGTTIIVRDAECLASVTGVDADKPTICNKGQFTDGANACGCPIGTTLNATENTCDGSKAISSAVQLFDLKWLSLAALLAIIFLSPIILKIYNSVKSNRQTIITRNIDDRRR